MSLFDRLKKKSADISKGVWDQANPFDGGKTFATAQRPVTNRPAIDSYDNEIRSLNKQANSGQIDRNVAATRIKALTTGGAVKPNTFVNTAAAKPTGLGGAIVNASATRKIAPVTSGLYRSAIGTGEGLSGLYDLATPGKGNNRIGQTIRRQGEIVDQSVKDNNYNRLAYKGGQVAGDVATFLLPGAASAKVAAKGGQIASKAPVIGGWAKNVNAAANAGNKSAKALRYMASPTNLVNATSDATISSGLRANRQQDISPITVGQDFTTSLATQGAIGLTGLGARTISKPVINTVKTGINKVDQGLKNAYFKPPTKLQTSQIDNMENWGRIMGTPQTMLKENIPVYEQAVRDAQIAGIDYKDPRQIQDLVEAHRRYDEAVAARKSKTNRQQGSIGRIDPNQPTVKNLFGQDIPNPSYKGAPKLTEEQYLAQNGAGFMNGAEPALHRQPNKAANAQKNDIKRTMQSIDENNTKRAELRKEYQDKLAKGEIVAPTRTEQLIQAANGLPELQSTQAAQRLLTKQGIDWTGGAPIEKTPTKQIDPEMQQVIDAAKTSIKDGDLEQARMIADSLPEKEGRLLHDEINKTQKEFEDQILKDVTANTDTGITDIENENVVMSDIAKKLAASINAPKGVYKFTGVKRTYRTPSGDLTVGGNVRSALDKVFFSGDITTMYKNIHILADKFGGPYREISDKIKANAPDGADYERFTNELSSLISKRPSYTPRSSAALKDSPVLNTQKPKASPTIAPSPQKPRIAVAAQPQPIKVKPSALVKASQQGIVPPNKPPVDNAPPQLTAGKQKKTKFASATVPNSDVVSEKIKGTIKAPEYSVQTEKQGFASAGQRYKTQGEETFANDVFSNLDKKPGTISRQDAIDAQSLAAILDARGDDASTRAATDIYEKLSSHYTAAGQLTQAAAMIARRSPEGLKSYAIKQLKNADVELTPQLQKELQKRINKVRTATGPDLERARYDVVDLVSRNLPTSLADKIINTWRAGLLTAPTTTGGNILGNTGETIVRKGFVNPVATAADAVMGAFTGKRTMSLAKAGSGANGALEGAKMLPDYMKTGYDPRNNNTKYDAPSRINTGSKALDGYINGVYRLMGVADMPYNTLAEKEALSSIAKSEAINKGLKGKARSDYVNEFMASPPETALARAQKEADYATFKNPTMLGKAATGLKKPLGAAGDFVVPFTQVPASIATRIVERTPVGTANEMIKQIVNVKKGGSFDQRAMSQAIGNGAFGPAVMGIGFALAGDNRLTYGYPSDEKERKLWDSEGKQPYSVRVGDRWYSLNYLQPFGTLLAIGGQAKQAANDGKKIDEIVGQGIATAGQSVMNQSFLKGIGGALDAISDPTRSMQKYVEQTTSSIVPNLVRSGARAADDIQRSPQGIVEGVKSGIPGLRGQTTPKLDMFGQPLPAKDTFVNQYLNPFKPSKARDNATLAELRRLYDTDNGVMPSEANANVFGKDTKLNNKQLQDLNRSTGKAMQPVYDEVVKSDQYKNLSEEDKVKTLKKINDVVYGAEKIAWGVKNGVIPADGSKLTKDQIAYLQGQGVDFFPKTPVVKVASTKKSSTKKTSSKKSTGRKASLPTFTTMSPSKGLVDTKVSRVAFAPVKKAVFTRKKTSSTKVK